LPLLVPAGVKNSANLRARESCSDLLLRFVFCSSSSSFILADLCVMPPRNPVAPPLLKKAPPPPRIFPSRDFSAASPEPGILRLRSFMLAFKSLHFRIFSSDVGFFFLRELLLLPLCGRPIAHPIPTSLFPFKWHLAFIFYALVSFLPLPPLPFARTRFVN